MICMSDSSDLKKSVGMNANNPRTHTNHCFESFKILFTYHRFLIGISTFTYTCQWNSYWSDCLIVSQNMPWDLW